MVEWQKSEYTDPKTGEIIPGGRFERVTLSGNLDRKSK